MKDSTKAKIAKSVLIGLPLAIVLACASGTGGDDEGGSGRDNSSAEEKSKYTTSQQNAIDSAESYLEFSGFSKDGLIRQLSSKAGDGFSKKDAEFAVAHIDVDWNAEAVESAESYLEFSAFSCDGLIRQLSSDAGDQYTKAQATHAAKKVGLC